MMDFILKNMDFILNNDGFNRRMTTTTARLQSLARVISDWFSSDFRLILV